MTKNEALKLALKALETNNKAWKHLADSGDAGFWEAEEQGFYELNVKAITAIKQALANEALEKKAENARELGLDYEPEHWEKFCDSNCVWTDHHPDCKLAEQEPVAWRAWVSKFPQGTGSDWVYVTKPIMKDSIHNQPLYTTPPQRTWVGLPESAFAGMTLQQVTAMKYAEQILKGQNT